LDRYFRNREIKGRDPQYQNIAAWVRDHILDREDNPHRIAVLDIPNVLNYPVVSEDTQQETIQITPFAQEMLPFLNDAEFKTFILRSPDTDERQLQHVNRRRKQWKDLLPTRRVQDLIPNEGENVEGTIRRKIEELRQLNLLPADVVPNLLFLSGRQDKVDEAFGANPIGTENARWLKARVSSPVEVYQQLMDTDENRGVFEAPLDVPTPQQAGLAGKDPYHVPDKLKTTLPKKFNPKPATRIRPADTNLAAIARNQRQEILRIMQQNKVTEEQAVQEHARRFAERFGQAAIPAMFEGAGPIEIGEGQEQPLQANLAERFRGMIQIDTPEQYQMAVRNDPNLRKFLLNMHGVVRRREAQEYLDRIEKPKPVVDMRRFKKTVPGTGAVSLEYTGNKLNRPVSMVQEYGDDYPFATAENLFKEMRRRPEEFYKYAPRLQELVDVFERHKEDSTIPLETINAIQNHAARLRDRAHEYERDMTDKSTSTALGLVQRVDHLLDAYSETRNKLDMDRLAQSIIRSDEDTFSEYDIFEKKLSLKTKKGVLLDQMYKIHKELRKNPQAGLGFMREKMELVSERINMLNREEISLNSSDLAGTLHPITERLVELGGAGKASLMRIREREAHLLANPFLQGEEREAVMEEISTAMAEAEDQLISRYKNRQADLGILNDEIMEIEEQLAESQTNLFTGVLVPRAQAAAEGSLNDRYQEAERDAIRQMDRLQTALKQKTILRNLLKSPIYQHPDRTDPTQRPMVRTVSDPRAHGVWIIAADRLIKTANQFLKNKTVNVNDRNAGLSALQKAALGLGQDYNSFVDVKEGWATAMEADLDLLQDIFETSRSINDPEYDPEESFFDIGRPIPVPRQKLGKSPMKKSTKRINRDDEGPQNIEKFPMISPTDDVQMSRGLIGALSQQAGATVPYKPKFAALSTGDPVADTKYFSTEGNPPRSVQAAMDLLINRGTNHRGLASVMNQYLTNRKSEVGSVAAAFLKGEGKLTGAKYDMIRQFVRDLDITKDRLARSWNHPNLEFVPDQMILDAIKKTPAEDLLTNKPLASTSRELYLDYTMKYKVGPRGELAGANYGDGPFEFGRGQETSFDREATKLIKSMITDKMMTQTRELGRLYTGADQNMQPFGLASEYGLVPQDFAVNPANMAQEGAIFRAHSMAVAMACLDLPLSAYTGPYRPLLNFARTAVSFYGNGPNSPTMISSSYAMSPGLEKDMNDLITKTNVSPNGPLKSILLKPNGILNAINGQVKTAEATIEGFNRAPPVIKRLAATMDVYRSLTRDLEVIANLVLVDAYKAGLETMTADQPQRNTKHMNKILGDLNANMGSFRYFIDTLKSLTDSVTSLGGAFDPAMPKLTPVRAAIANIPSRAASNYDSMLGVKFEEQDILAQTLTNAVTGMFTAAVTAFLVSANTTGGAIHKVIAKNTAGLNVGQAPHSEDAYQQLLRGVQRKDPNAPQQPREPRRRPADNPPPEQGAVAPPQEEQIAAEEAPEAEPPPPRPARRRRNRSVNAPPPVPAPALDPEEGVPNAEAFVPNPVRPRRRTPRAPPRPITLEDEETDLMASLAAAGRRINSPPGTQVIPNAYLPQDDDTPLMELLNHAENADPNPQVDPEFLAMGLHPVDQVVRGDDILAALTGDIDTLAGQFTGYQRFEFGENEFDAMELENSQRPRGPAPPQAEPPNPEAMPEQAPQPEALPAQAQRIFRAQDPPAIAPPVEQPVAQVLGGLPPDLPPNPPRIAPARPRGRNKAPPVATRRSARSGGGVDYVALAQGRGISKRRGKK
jgi:hypothetical protein